MSKSVLRDTKSSKKADEEIYSKGELKWGEGSCKEEDQLMWFYRF